MKNQWLTIIIIVLTLGAILVDMPAMIRFPRWSLRRPPLNVDFLGIHFSRDLEIKKGLDLAGGTQLTLQADMSQITPTSRNTALDSLQSVIERRVNLYGVSEPLVQTSRVGNDYRIVVELPGVTDVNQALNLIGQTANLTFREEASPSADIATEAAQLYGPYQKLTELSGKDLEQASAAFNQQTGEPEIQLTFTPEGAKKFAAITQRDIGKKLAIFLDNQFLMGPTVQSVISDGRAVVTGQFTSTQTKQIALLLNSGALPTPVRVVEQRTIGATLGQDSINKSLLAGIIGLSIVALFMISNYGRLGLFADLALIIYSLITLAIFKLVPITLTLAGIAGFILSIGMAVDANILVFERMREEIRWGRNKLAALELGFTRAFPSIRDSNVSSLITCGILYWFGTGPVKGFALTLAIGIVVSLFTAITVTRVILRFASSRKLI